MHTTPRTLLEQLKQPHQPAAWERFADLYTPLLYHWAKRMGVRGEEAKDLVQEVFMLLVRKLPDFNYDRDRGFRNWLRTVTYNKWRELCRRKTPATAEGADPDAVPAPADDTFEEIDYRRYLTGRALELIQSQFEATTWKAFWEHVVGERPVAEVARELGITANAVYIAKSRVLARLRLELEGLLE